ncbi:hypothetical protein ANCDUO_14100 [Ancylostoma duodenale]|uniref:Uncharacterized protein n=1 Tax=Ancylostoma duodenale TaxID=51022 RepID=A0A0C2D126_9BILA|nr:hypothetical protein ANCDUO_14100 [Ancylostoma duodenale]
MVSESPHTGNRSQGYQEITQSLSGLSRMERGEPSKSQTLDLCRTTDGLPSCGFVEMPASGIRTRVHRRVTRTSYQRGRCRRRIAPLRSRVTNHIS